MTELPLVAIGMPVRDREKVLPKVLDAILALDYQKKRIRIIFNENFSKDRTLQIIEDFKKKHGEAYENAIIIHGEGVLGELRNQCIGQAKGTYAIIFIDSDVIVKPNTLRRLVKHIETPNVGMSMIPYPPPGWPRGPSEEMFALSSPQRVHETLEVGMGCTAIKMSILTKTGLFPVLHRNEDGAFSHKVHMAGYKIICDPTDPVYHLHTGYWNYYWFYWHFMGRARWELIKVTHSPRLIFRMIYYTGYIATIPLILITYVPFVAMTVVTFTYHFFRYRGAYGRLIGPLFSLTAGVWTTICTWKEAFLDLIGRGGIKREEEIERRLKREFAVELKK